MADGLRGRSEPFRAKSRAWWDANRDRGVARTRAWREANAERAAMHWRAREARKREAPGSHTYEQLAARMASYGFACAYCGGAFEHLDHVKPLVAGGSNFAANLRPACAACNQRKNRRWPIDGLFPPRPDLADRRQRFRMQFYAEVEETPKI